MPSALHNFVAPIEAFGRIIMKSAARLSHVGDGASLLLSRNQQMSRYTSPPTGQAAISAVQLAIVGITTTTNGINAQMAAATVALQAADLVHTMAVETAGKALLAATPQTVGPLLLAYVTAIQASAPIDAIPMLFRLADAVPMVGASPYVTYFRILILCALAQSVLDYAPQTSDAAVAILNQYVNLFDATVTPASDLGWSDAVLALGSLRSNVLQYLQQQIAIEPRVMQQTFQDSLPDVVVAYSLYGDANMASQLVKANNPANPLFMPRVINYNNPNVG